MLKSMVLPMLCHFCSEPITKFDGLKGKSLVIHHLNGNRDDNGLENLVPFHRGCHTTYHCKGKSHPLISKRRKYIQLLGDKIVCYFCGKVITKRRGKSSESLSIHHLNGNKYDNRIENLMPTHVGCHSSYSNTGDKISNHNGLTDIHKRRIGDSNRGKKLTDEHKKKIGLAIEGNRHTGKTKNKLREIAIEKAQEVWRKRRERYGPSGSKTQRKKGSNDPSNRRMIETRHKNDPEGLCYQKAVVTRRKNDPNGERFKKGWETRRERYGSSGMRRRRER